MSKIDNIEDIDEVLEEVDILENDEEVTEEEVTEEEPVVVSTALSVRDVMEYAKATNTSLELFTGEYTTLAELNAVVVAERTRVASIMESTPTPQPTHKTDTQVSMSEKEKVAAYEAAIDGINSNIFGD